MKKLTRPVPNYTHIYFPYSTVTSACQGIGLACTRTVSVFRTLTYMHVFSSPKQTILHRYQNETNTVNQLQLNYSTNIHLTLRFTKSLFVITIQLKTLNWCPIPNDSGWGICLRMWKPVKEIALTIFNNGRVYTYNRSVKRQVFSRGPRRLHYNGVAVYIHISLLLWQCIYRGTPITINDTSS